MASKKTKRFAVTFVLISLLIITLGKALYSATQNLFLLIYGITVTVTILLVFFISLRYKDMSVEIRTNSLDHKLRKPFISCVLAVRNEEKLITKCIDSLLNSDYKNKEILVVNDASTDNTLKILQDKYKNNPIVKIINLEKNVGKKRAIGQALRIAKGEIFVFTDSDSVVAPDAISKIIEIFMYDKDVGAVNGHGRALNSSENLLTKIQDSWYHTQYAVKKAFESVFGAVTCVAGPLAVFRRSAIYNYIPAWENDTFLGQEFRFATDRQLTSYVLGSRYIGNKLKKKYSDSEFVKNENYPTKEWKVIYCKSAKVWTIVPNTLKKAVHQQIRWKKSFIRNIFSTGKFYWRKPILPALRFYLAIIFVLLGPFIALRHLIYLPLTGNILSAVFYLSGILFIGCLYAMMYAVDNSDRLWVYRPLMNLLSTLVYSWLIFYSIFTIRKMVWHRA